MAATPPPGYTPPPADLPQRGDRATFSNRVDAWVTWFSTVILTQLAAIVANAYANALDAAASATAALGYRDAALGARDAAVAARDLAQSYRDTALTYRDQAADSATAAANTSAGFNATSNTSLVISTGSKTVATQAGKQFSVGMYLLWVNPADGTQYMAGQVTAYSGTSLTMDVQTVGGAGATVTSWNIALSGPRGATGAAGSLSGANMTGPINLARGADVASSSTPDLWSGTGNYEVLTGSVTVLGFAAAPQAGADRRVLVAGTPTLTADANLIIKGVQSGQSVTLAPGDEFDVYAETTTRFRVTIHKGDGTAMAGLYGSFMNIRAYTSVDVFVAPRTGWYRITAIGAGGRGAIATGSIAVALGGASGGFVVGMRFLIAGQSCTVSPGAQTVLATAAGGGVVAGTAGGNSVFSATGITTITAGGGQGGTGSITSGSVPTAPAGGTAIGGDINVPGSPSGTVNLVVAGVRAATGGASPGFGGAAYPSGTITISGTPSNLYLATGGAGIGGKSADIATALASLSSATGGAGSRGPSVGNNGGPNFAGVSETVAGNAGSPVATFDDGIFVALNATGGGSPRTVDASSGPGKSGAGSGAAVSNSTQVSAGAAGSFAGSGGVALTTGASGVLVGAAGIGAGSGGLAAASGSAHVVQAGGVGRITVEW